MLVEDPKVPGGVLFSLFSVSVNCSSFVENVSWDSGWGFAR
jgi:hypothetical protein